MPRLALLAPARVVSRDADTNVMTLAHLLETVAVTPGEDNPQLEGVLPESWAILTIWHRQPGDEGQTFYQRVTLTGPNGTTWLDGEGSFEMTAPYHRMILRVNAFPIGGPGLYDLRLYLRRHEDPLWTESGNYPIEVTIPPRS